MRSTTLLSIENTFEDWTDTDFSRGEFDDRKRRDIDLQRFKGSSEVKSRDQRQTTESILQIDPLASVTERKIRLA